MIDRPTRDVLVAIRNNAIFSFLSEFAPIYPAYMILFKDRAYGFVELSLLFVVWELSVVVLELPTGILADRCDKRRALALGMGLKALGFLAWLLSPSFAAAAIGFALWGAQEAFCSGTKQALLYETLSSGGLESSYGKAAGVSNAMSTAAVALSLVIGGPVYAASPEAALALSAVSGVVGAAAALRIRGGRYHGRSAPTVLKGAADGSRGQAGPTIGRHPSVIVFLDAVKKRGMRSLLAAACLAIASYGTLDEFDGLWAMGRYGVPMGWIGAWGALRFGAEALGGLAGGFMAGSTARVGSSRATVGMGLAGAAFAASAFLPGLFGAPLYIGAYAIMAAVNVALETRLQEAAADENRAAFLSYSSLLMTLCAMALAPVLGAAGDAGGLGSIIALGGTIIVAAALPLAASGIVGGVRRRSSGRA